MPIGDLALPRAVRGLPDRGLLPQLIGTSVSHPALLATYREQHIRPRTPTSTR
ncbi:hypothetical protein [Saccharothrix coeruleofusca]|uniref:Uncharacterized protein n=1 Tax=Saccharothrix coeruleofusca TaxID=33919 RepID=A0A918ATA0_9PSEU|nr:hypothetical protein [Saccharothrix coeruleofusca]GGP82300.1 hypothetical protein GCM10010185_65560 [Saccharothrix coeruleofusca]